MNTVGIKDSIPVSLKGKLTEEIDNHSLSGRVKFVYGSINFYRTASSRSFGPIISVNF